MIGEQHPHQREIFLDPTRFRVAVCGRRWGKSVLGLETALECAYRVKLSKIFIVCPTREMAKDLFWEPLKRRAGDLRWSAKVNESELSLRRNSNGSVIQLKSAEKPDRLRGRGLNYCVLDEFADMDAEIWREVIRPALADRRGRALFIGTPKGRNHFYELYESAGTDPEWRRWSYRTIDSPFIGADEVQQARRDLDERTFRQEFEADFVDYLGRAYVYHDALVHRQARPFNPALPVSCALDFNLSPCIWEMGQIDGDKLHVFGEIVQRETDIWRMCAELKRRLEQVGAKPGSRIDFYGDYTSAHRRDVSATAASWDIIRSEFSGYASQFWLRSNPVILDRVNAVNARLRSADGTIRLSYDPKCIELGKDFDLVDMEMLTTKKGQAGDRTHASDAIGYLVSYKWPILGGVSRYLK